MSLMDAFDSKIENTFLKMNVLAIYCYMDNL